MEEWGHEGGGGGARARPGWAGPGMEVSCPACGGRYLLPGGLLGPWGAKVRCPGCGQRFEVRLEGSAAELAERILDRLEERWGARIRQANAQGRLFSQCGPELLEAFDAFQRGAGPGGEARVFRRALRRRWGIELETGA